MLIGEPPPTLSSTAGVIHPLVAMNHGWCESTVRASGGAGAVVRVLALATVRLGRPGTRYEAVADSVACPVTAASGTATEKTAVGELPAVRRDCCEACRGA